jgi:hypothetical protein
VNELEQRLQLYDEALRSMRQTSQLGTADADVVDNLLSSKIASPDGTSVCTTTISLELDNGKPCKLLLETSNLTTAPAANYTNFSSPFRKTSISQPSHHRAASQLRRTPPQLVCQLDLTIVAMEFVLK